MRLQMARLLSKNDEESEQKLQYQTQLDNKFEDLIEGEYADDQIGDLEDDSDDNEQQEDFITKEMLNEAMDEYIEDQKLRDRKLY